MRYRSLHTQGTVMIVDDVPANLALLSDALEEAGYRVLVATDGACALEQLRYVKPDVILLDGMMPGMDGFETCRRLKDDSSTAAIPVIFMTALGELDDLLRGFDEGAVDYIVKPIRNEEVLARVGAHTAQARAVHRAETALTQSGLAAMAVDGGGRITWMTEPAAEWLSDLLAGESTASVPGTLPPALKEWAQPVLRSGILVPEFSTTKGGARYTACVAPAESGGEFLLMLHKRSGDWNLERLRGSLGLTFKEAEVLMWVARGKTNREVGMILGSSPRTVNKHLEHVFEKLGVETRSAAVAIATEKARAEA
ncbi:response regulator transcription factor [Methyloterricola oryzae]|uniref:response regulator transcription factor n=1 Tax=Methyloterricola oryzae TaxID=1495050 RepID=UPI0005EBEC17|nr:response regulator transcription factor [Methyloterricola oryzae]